MDALSDLLNGFATALTPTNLAWAALGVILGTMVGVLPGIGPAMTVALLLPVTYGLDPTVAIIMLAFIAVTAVLGSSRIRGFASLAIGLTIGLIGIDLATGQQRLTFGVPQLADGEPLLAGQ